MASSSHSMWFLGPFHLVTLPVLDSESLGRDHGQVSVFEIHDGPRVLENGRRVGSDEELSLPASQANQNRRPPAGHHDLVRFGRGEDGQALGAFDVAQGLGDPLLQDGPRGLFDQVGQQLGIRWRDHGVTPGLQEGTKSVRVLDDAVVDDGDGAGAVGMGMRVAQSRGSVRGPARVPDARRGRDRLGTDHLGQVGYRPATLRISRPLPFWSATPAES